MSCENCEESAHVIDKLAKLLAEIAVIVNGVEPHDTLWSYHDLPEKVRALKAQPAPVAVPDGLDELVKGLAELSESVRELGHAGYCRVWKYGAGEDRCECGLIPAAAHAAIMHIAAKRLAAALVHTAPVEVAADDEGSALAGWLLERGLISAHDLPMAMGELLDTLSNHEAELVKVHPDGGAVTAYAKLPGAMTGSDHASSLGPLTGDERKAVGGVMVNAEHDAIDVEDACPRIEANEDAYWAWHTYHGLKKLVAIGDRQEALEASLKLERECHAISYRNATALGERVHRLECAIRAISASLSSGGTGHDLDENDPVILELREQITRLTQGGGLIPSNDALQDGLDAAKNAGAEGVDIGVIADIFNSVQAAAVAERNKDAGAA